MGKQRASLKDVAQVAGVSVMTVSNVMNGKLERVSEPIAQKVRSVVAELNYRPQSRGLRLRLQRNFAVGLVIVHPDRRFLDDPFITEVAAGLSNQLADAGYHLAIFGVGTVEELSRRSVQIDHVDALAVISSGGEEDRRTVYLRLGALGMPMIVVADPYCDFGNDTLVVRQDDRGGARSLAHGVCSRGARHLLFLGPDHTWPAISERLIGVREGSPPDAEVEELRLPEFSFASVVCALRDRFTSKPLPDAVIGGNDMFGIAAVHAAQSMGIEVPSMLKVTGFNAFASRAYCQPLLSSVQSRAYDLGRAASDAMLARLTLGYFAGGEILLNLDPAPGATV